MASTVPWIAIPKILKILAECDLSASLPTAPASALPHPREVESNVAGVHEIHERNTVLERSDELDLTGRALPMLKNEAAAPWRPQPTEPQGGQ